MSTPAAEVPDIPPTRPHPGWIITAVISSLKSLVWALIPLLFSIRDQGAAAIAMATALFGAAVVAWRFIEWRHLRYSAMDDTISVLSGVFGRSQKSVRPERIHAVDTIETPLDRLLGICELRITTAGAGENLSIPAISNEDAEELRNWIAARRTPMPSISESEVESVESGPVVLRRLSTQELLLAGLTSGQIAPAAAIAAFSIRIVSEVLPQSMIDRIPWDPHRLTPVGIVGLVFVAALLAWGLSIAGSVLTNWDFTLARSPDNLIVSSGLLDRKQNSVAIRRIQGVSIVESFLRQPFGYAEITIQSAATQHGDEAVKVRYLFPFLKRNEAYALIHEAIPPFQWVDPTLPFQGLPQRSRRRYLLPAARNLLLAIAIVSIVLAATEIGEWWYGPILLILLPMLLFHAFRQFRDAGWWTGTFDQLAVRRRGLDLTTSYTFGHKVQIRELTRNWLQRRADLGTVWLQTSARGHGSTLEVTHLDCADGQALLRELGPVYGRAQRATILTHGSRSSQKETSPTS